MSAAMTLRPAKPLVHLSSNGEPSICGYRCLDCGVAATEPTLACRRCASRRAPESFTASRSGALYSWSVVERTYPGVKTPFISAIVDLDDGLTVKGTLVADAASALRAGMPVRVVFDDAGGAVAADGGLYVGYHFTLAPPVSGASS